MSRHTVGIGLGLGLGFGVEVEVVHVAAVYLCNAAMIGATAVERAVCCL